MHEMSLVESVREIVEQAARSHGARRVRVVRLQIGARATVEPEALRFCFDVVMRGSVADGAALEIEPVAATGWCWDCSRAIELGAGGTACPCCGGQRLEITGGTEMRVHEIDLDLQEESVPCA